jgi:hypothetical protein
MTLRVARWSPSRMAAIWAAGLLLEGALLVIMFILLVPPQPPLVARLRGERPSAAEIVLVRADAPPTDTLTRSRRVAGAPIVDEDSFYTIVHWPLDRPLLAGGGHVVAVPMRFWWVPALYVSTVPLLLMGVTGIWLWSRRRAPGIDPGP